MDPNGQPSRLGWNYPNRRSSVMIIIRVYEICMQEARWEAGERVNFSQCEPIRLVELTRASGIAWHRDKRSELSIHRLPRSFMPTRESHLFKSVWRLAMMSMEDQRCRKEGNWTEGNGIDWLSSHRARKISRVQSDHSPPDSKTFFSLVLSIGGDEVSFDPNDWCFWLLESRSRLFSSSKIPECEESKIFSYGLSHPKIITFSRESLPAPSSLRAHPIGSHATNQRGRSWWW